MKALRPITEEEKNRINMNNEGPVWTVCEVIRNIYKLASQIDDPKAKEIMEKARTAIAMTKRMNSKLREYKGDYDEGWWENKEEK